MSETTKESIPSFISSALRGPKQGSYEQLLCQHLINSVNARPLHKIRLVCEATMLTEGSLDSSDLDLAKKIYVIQNGLTEPTQLRIDQFGNLMFKIAWGFEETEQNFIDLIESWLNPNFEYYSKFIRVHRIPAVEIYHNNLFPRCSYTLKVISDTSESAIAKAKEDVERRFKSCPCCGDQLSSRRLDTADTTVVTRNPFWSFFFEATDYLTQSGYKQLVNSFVSWAIPQTQVLFGRLAKLVSPELYQEILQTIEGKSVREDSE